MKCNAERLIEALVMAQMAEYQHDVSSKYKAEAHPRNTLTVSRECGSLGLGVADLLADALEVCSYDRYILHEVAQRANVDEELVEALDQNMQAIGDHWWQRLLHEDHLSVDEYHEYLVKTVLSISDHGGVIIGRGANIILGPERAFRVRITGSVKYCAGAIAQRKNIDLEQATRLARKENRKRTEYIRKLYDIDINDLGNYDLVLNAERYQPIDMVEMILIAMQKAGFSLPRDALTSLQAHSS